MVPIKKTAESTDTNERRVQHNCFCDQFLLFCQIKFVCFEVAMCGLVHDVGDCTCPMSDAKNTPNKLFRASLI